MFDVYCFLEYRVGGNVFNGSYDKLFGATASYMVRLSRSCWRRGRDGLIGVEGLRNWEQLGKLVI